MNIIKFTLNNLKEGFKLEIETKLPFIYTLIKSLGETDKIYLELSWQNNRLNYINEFFEWHKIKSDCKCVIKIWGTMNGKNKKLTPGILKKHITGIRVEFNKKLEINKPTYTKLLGINNVEKFIGKLDIQNFIQSKNILIDLYSYAAIWYSEERNKTT
jgi:hypothetical protein